MVKKSPVNSKPVLSDNNCRLVMLEIKSPPKIEADFLLLKMTFRWGNWEAMGGGLLT